MKEKIAVKQLSKITILVRLVISLASVFTMIATSGCERSSSARARLIAQKESAAERGDISAQMWLAKRFDEGIEGIQRDPKRASQLISKAAASNDPAAQYALASRYEDGNGIEKDDLRAVRWYERCANNGRGEWQGAALVALSNRYRHGNGVLRDEALAVELSAKAAIQGEASAIFSLAMHHLVRKDDAAGQHIGKALLEAAAEQGNAPAERLMAIGYENGLFTLAKDLSSAAKWARKAAEQGDPEAEYLLSGFLLEGRGVGRDEKQAAGWCLNAATHGHAGAMLRIGKLYSQGVGVAKDMKLALQWGRQGAEALLQEAEVKYKNNEISRKELEEVRKIAHNFKKSRLPGRIYG